MVLGGWRILFEIGAKPGHVSRAGVQASLSGRIAVRIDVIVKVCVLRDPFAPLAHFVVGDNLSGWDAMLFHQVPHQAERGEDLTSSAK